MPQYISPEFKSQPVIAEVRSDNIERKTTAEQFL
jgi:hypothetical protein